MKRALLLLAACADDPDPCAGIASCVALRIEAPAIDRIDQLELDVLYGDRRGTAATELLDGGAVRFPIVTAIELAPLAEPALLGVVAAGKLEGSVLGAGAATATYDPAAPLALVIDLGPPPTCMPGGFYCGRNELPGDPDTLYLCGNGVPLARGRCAGGCVIRPGDDDACRGVGGPCSLGDYCGGNELDGDPQSLYTCGAGGAATNRRECPDGCQINPGDDDTCR